MCPHVPLIEAAGRRFASLDRVLRDEFPCFSGTTKALRLPAVRPAALRYLVWRYLPRSTRLFRSPADECAARPELVTGYSGGMSLRKRQEIQVLETPIVRLQCSVELGRTADTRPVRCSSMALVWEKSRGSHEGLSTLNSMASGIAVIASPRASYPAAKPRCLLIRVET